MSSTDIIELGALPEARFGAFESLFVIAWRGEVTAGTLEQLTAVEEQLVRAQGRISVLNVVNDSATGTPDSRLIRVATATMKHFDPQLRAAAVVLRDDGPGSTVRVVLDGLLILAGDAERYRCFRDLDSALSWLASMPGESPALARPEVAAAVKRFSVPTP